MLDGTLLLDETFKVVVEPIDLVDKAGRWDRGIGGMMAGLVRGGVIWILVGIWPCILV